MLAVAGAVLGLQQGAAPSALSRSSKIGMSRYTGEIWDIPAKQAIFAEWDPEAQRTYDNFNPFERDSVGNACDTNGKFPGETAYKDPIRPDVNFAQMQADRETMAEIMKDPKTAHGQAGQLE